VVLVYIELDVVLSISLSEYLCSCDVVSSCCIWSLGISAIWNISTSF